MDSSPALSQSPPSRGDAAVRGDDRAERPLPFLTRFKFDLVRGILSAWMKCFSLTGLYKLGKFFGTCEYLLDYHRRRRVGVKLSQIFPEGLTPRQRRLMTWRYFCRIRCDKMLYLILDKVPREKLLKRIRWHGREHLATAQERGKGSYVMLAHYGSHHVAGFMLALLGYQVSGVRDPKEAPLRRYIQEKFTQTFPEASAVRVYYADTFPRMFYREFQENGILCSALDIDRFRGAQLKTCPVRIFGEQREFLTGTLQIALRCGASVMQGFVISRKNYYYRWELSPPLIDPARGRDEPEIVAEVMQKYADGIERHARQHPDHLMKI